MFWESILTADKSISLYLDRVLITSVQVKKTVQFLYKTELLTQFYHIIDIDNSTESDIEKKL